MTNEVYSYNYSAQQNEEVQAIRNKYLPQPESKLEELRRLDNRVRSARELYQPRILELAAELCGEL